jgi:AcrR family transcriptional regulator
MPRERFLNLPLEDRSRLLGIAMKELAARGFDDASLNGILAEAGISKGAYYYYFEDKEDLFATAIEGALDEVLARLPLPAFERLTPEEFWPAVERAVGEWTTLFDSSRELVQATLRLKEAWRHSPRFAAVLAKGQLLWRTLIEAGQRLGCVRTDIPTEMLVRLVQANDHALDAMFSSASSELTRDAFQRHIALVFDTLKRLLAVEVPAPGGRPPARERRRRT